MKAIITFLFILMLGACAGNTKQQGQTQQKSIDDQLNTSSLLSVERDCKQSINLNGLKITIATDSLAQFRRVEDANLMVGSGDNKDALREMIDNYNKDCVGSGDNKDTMMVSINSLANSLPPSFRGLEVTCYCCNEVTIEAENGQIRVLGDNGQIARYRVTDGCPVYFMNTKEKGACFVARSACTQDEI